MGILELDKRRVKIQMGRFVYSLIFSLRHGIYFPAFLLCAESKLPYLGIFRPVINKNCSSGVRKRRGKAGDL
jgi:hypothetical protein